MDGGPASPHPQLPQFINAYHCFTALNIDARMSVAAMHDGVPPPHILALYLSLPLSRSVRTLTPAALLFLAGPSVVPLPSTLWQHTRIRRVGEGGGVGRHRGAVAIHLVAAYQDKVFWWGREGVGGGGGVREPWGGRVHPFLVAYKDTEWMQVGGQAWGMQAGRENRLPPMEDDGGDADEWQQGRAACRGVDDVERPPRLTTPVPPSARVSHTCPPAPLCVLLLSSRLRV